MNPKIALLLVLALSLISCGSGGGSSSSSIPTNPGVQATATAVPKAGNYSHIQITPGTGTVCSSQNYINAPCITVTVCDTQNNCQDINNVLIDSGSYGLRIFKSLIQSNVNLTPITNISGKQIAECISYADGTSNWGTVAAAIVSLKNDVTGATTSTTTAIPIQLLDANYTGMSTNCPGAVASPSEFQLNGIIGVGPLPNDNIGANQYFACNSSGCNTIVPTANQYLLNPISQFSPGNNNGITFTFGSIPQTGAYGADGYAIFGINSNIANTPSSTTKSLIIDNSKAYPINVYTYFPSNTVNNSFLDTGSNFLFFSNTTFLPQCGDGSGAFCPTIGQFIAESSTISDFTLTVSTASNFNIGNAQWLFNGSNTAFSTIAYGGSSLGTNLVDWGMPFFYGKTVYIAFAVPSNANVIVAGKSYDCSNYGCWIF